MENLSQTGNEERFLLTETQESNSPQQNNEIGVTMDDIRLRQRDLIKDACFKVPIVLIGVGGIGSAVAACLDKVGFEKVIVYDHDRVEAHNIPNQWYTIEDIGRSKSAAIVNKLRNFPGNLWASRVSLFDRDTKTIEPVVISCVDSIEARKEIWDIVRPSECKFYIDCRMGGEQLSIYSMDNRKVNSWYDKTLWSKEEEHNEPCTAQAVMYNTMVCAGLCVSNLKKMLMDQVWDQTIIFDLFSMGFIRIQGK